VAHAKQEQIRQRFGCRCGYCGVSEVDTGGSLTVDHFQPVAAGGDDSDDNLVYACFKCNQYKGDFHPSPTDLRNGWRVLHPIRDNLAVHLSENNQTGMLEPLTETGRFHITLLHLNRPALVEFRLRRRLADLLAARQRLLEAENAHLRAILAAQADYIRRLRRLLGLPPESE
jgi:hypothetical protein